MSEGDSHMGDDSIATLHARIAAAIAGTTKQREPGSWSPVERYLDPARHEVESRALRSWPVPVAEAAKLAAPGAWLATRAQGVPVLLARGRDGTLRAFLNVCRHRGAALAEDGDAGNARTRFVCPYHSWTYDDTGRCVGRPHEADFAQVPRESVALVELPCTQRFGLAWVVPARSSGFDWDAYFGPLGIELDGLGFTDAAQVVHERRFDHASNWKLVFDANLESYHFAYAHRRTIAHLFHDNAVVHDRFGDHQRIVLPKRAFEELRAPPATLEGFAKAINTIYYFFPATLLLWEGDHLNGFAVTPTRVDASRIDGWMIAPAQHRASRSPDYWRRNFEMFWAAIDEDYALAASMQRGLASGANEALTFGANEFACAAFHAAVERIAPVARAG
jgi:choline monooxygenase